MRFTFGEEKNSDSRDSNHNTLAQNNLQPDWITASLYSLQKKKSRFRGKNRRYRFKQRARHRRRCHRTNGSQGAVCVIACVAFLRLMSGEKRKWREIGPARIWSTRWQKVASELGMKGNEVSAVSFHPRHFSHLSPVWHFHSCSER